MCRKEEAYPSGQRYPNQRVGSTCFTLKYESITLAVIKDFPANFSTEKVPKNKHSSLFKRNVSFILSVSSFKCTSQVDLMLT
jgi:hypothetical protein